MRTFALVVLALSAVTGCSRDGGVASSASTSPGTASAPPGTPATPPPASKSLTGPELEAAFSALHSDDPFAAKLADLTAKLGKPARVEGDTSHWYGWDAKKGWCTEVSLSNSQGAVSGFARPDKCGH